MEENIVKVNKPSKCNGCGEEIMWLKTKNGKNIPVNIPNFDDGESAHEAVTTAIEFNPDYMVSHFATCKYANKFRKGDK